MVHSPPLDSITSPRRLITNEMDPRFIYPKSLAGRVGGRVLEARLLGYGSIHCALEVGKFLHLIAAEYPGVSITHAIFL
jgi:hypothetical protein